MYTSYIGKKFLQLYNQHKKTNLSAQEFFEKHFFELFFNHERHLMHVGNSPFFQKPKPKDVEKHGSKALAQLNNLTEKMEAGAPSGAIFVGFAAEDIQATTSGQLTDMNFGIDTEEMYTSWLGQALAIGVNGGLVMLIDKPEVLWHLYEGWQHYRDYLAQTPNVKGKQIETWNGHWLRHCFSKDYDPDFPDEGFEVETASVVGKIAIPTSDWSKVVFALARKYPNQTITAYVYSLSQTNTTLGFINLYLPQIRTMYELRDAVFLEKEGVILKDHEIENLQTFFNFKNACKLGTIGLKALEPDKLRAYMPKGSVEYATGKDFKFKDETSYFNYQLYKLWITAMLNKVELLALASQLATALIAIEDNKKGSNRGKTDKTNLAKGLMDSKNVKQFADGLTEVLSKDTVSEIDFKELLTEVLGLASDQFPLFMTLLRFDYQYQKSKS